MRRDDSGAIAIMVALFAVVLFGFAALVVDVGNAADVKAQASTAADAGALAGARALAAWANVHGTTPDKPLEAAVQDAVTDAVERTYPVADSAWSACEDTVPGGLKPITLAQPSTQCIQYAVSSTESIVRVRIPVRRVPSTFGGIFGVSSIAVSPVAAAAAGQHPLPNCEPCQPILDEHGQPASHPALPNELPPLPEPALVPNPGGSLCPTPGTYIVDVTIDSDCSLTPGMYVFDGGNLDVNANLTTQALEPGVTLVFYGTGTLQVATEATLSLRASLAGASFAGEIPGVALVLAQDPNNPPPSIPARIFSLGAKFLIQGSVYALDNTLWQTHAGDCLTPPSGTCEVDGALAVWQTAFGSEAPDVPPVIPAVRTLPAPALPSPEPEHLTE